MEANHDSKPMREMAALDFADSEEADSFVVYSALAVSVLPSLGLMLVTGPEVYFLVPLILLMGFVALFVSLWCGMNMLRAAGDYQWARNSGDDKNHTERMRRHLRRRTIALGWCSARLLLMFCTGL